MSRPSRKLLESMVTVPRRWTALPTLDWYVMREFLIKFSILLLVSAMFFILGDVFNDLSDFLEEDAPIGSIIKYFILKLPGNIGFVLPISVLLGCMWTMAMFGKNLEVTAMRASGLSLMRCGRSIFMIGFLVTLVNIYFNEMLVPEYNMRAAALQRKLTRKQGFLEDYQKMLTFKSFDGQRTWLFQTFDDDGRYNGVTLKTCRPDGTLESYVTAEYGNFNMLDGWRMFNGSRTFYSNDGFIVRSQEKFDSLTLERRTMNDSPETIENAVKNVDVLPCWTILDVVISTENMSKRSTDIYWTVFCYRLAFPWASFIAVFLGIPLATKNERSGIMLAVITAIGVIVAYIVVSEMFKVLGRQGILPPVLAGFAPTLAFIIYGYWNVRRDRI